MFAGVGGMFSVCVGMFLCKGMVACFKGEVLGMVSSTPGNRHANDKISNKVSFMYVFFSVLDSRESLFFSFFFLGQICNFLLPYTPSPAVLALLPYIMKSKILVTRMRLAD